MRLIDADALKHEIATIMPSRIEVFLVVDKMPDAIVRCKDCKNLGYTNSHWFCKWLNRCVDEDWFCGDGVARDINVPGKEGR